MGDLDSLIGFEKAHKIADIAKTLAAAVSWLAFSYFVIQLGRFVSSMLTPVFIAL